MLQERATSERKIILYLIKPIVNFLFDKSNCLPYGGFLAILPPIFLGDAYVF